MPVADTSVFGKIMTKRDFDRAEEEFQLRKQKAQQALTGQDPAALKIANKLGELQAVSRDPNATMEEKKIAAQAIRNINDAQKITKYSTDTFFNPYTNQVEAMRGAPQAAGQLSGGKERGKLQEQEYYKPRIESKVTTAKGEAETGLIPERREAERKAEEAEQAITAGKQIPEIETLKQLNEASPVGPYAGKTQFLRRLTPGTSEKEAAVDLMKQARLEMAAPLAKQLGVNPTDKDFQASLDRVFDLDATKESRKRQIEALERKIRRKASGAPSTLYELGEQQFNQGKDKVRLKWNPATGDFE